jgi:hypothetical protein
METVEQTFLICHHCCQTCGRVLFHVGSCGAAASVGRKELHEAVIGVFANTLREAMHALADLHARMAVVD